MGTRKFRPTTPSRRFMSGSDFTEVSKDSKPEVLAHCLSTFKTYHSNLGGSKRSFTMKSS